MRFNYRIEYDGPNGRMWETGTVTADSEQRAYEICNQHCLEFPNGTLMSFLCADLTCPEHTKASTCV